MPSDLAVPINVLARQQVRWLPLTECRLVAQSDLLAANAFQNRPLSYEHVLSLKSVERLRHIDSLPSLLLGKNRETIAPVASSAKLKKPLLLILLLALVLLEAVILEAFLPYEWQHAIQHQTDRIFPREKYDPHPDMGWEFFELDYRQHPSHRAVLYAVAAILSVGNAYLIAKVWKALNRLKAPTARD